MSDTPRTVQRDRSKPIAVGAAEVRGATVLFSMADHRQLEFSTLPATPVPVLGVSMSVRGTLRFATHSFDVQSVDIAEAYAADRAACSPSDRGSYYLKDIHRGLETLVREAFAKMASGSPEALPDACLEKLDDMALAAMDDIRDYSARRAGAEDYGSARVLDDMTERRRRELEGIDEAGAGHAYPFTSMPAYLVTIGGRPAAKPTDWGHNPEGWLGKLLHRSHFQAARMVEDIANPEAVVERVRVIEGVLHLVRADGFHRLGTPPTGAVHTFRAERRSA